MTKVTEQEAIDDMNQKIEAGDKKQKEHVYRAKHDRRQSEAESPTSPNIYQRINAVMQEVKYAVKDKTVGFGKSAYRAVTHDNIVSVARESFVKHGIALEVSQSAGDFIIMRDVNATPEPIKMGLYSGEYSISLVNIDNPEDRSTGIIHAHANDNGDKAPGKALTYAVKSFIIKSLWLETGENDESREEVSNARTCIDVSQMQELKSKAETARSHLESIVKSYGVSRLADLSIKSFNNAMKTLDVKIKSLEANNENNKSA